MKKTKQIKLCDWGLMACTIAMLGSSIQMEITAGSLLFWVWVHILLGLLFFGLITWHLQLHFQWRNWFRLLWSRQSSNMKWLTVISILTLLTSIIATAGWLCSPDHSKIGAIHGKLGFLFVALAAWHIIRRIGFYKR